jgi:hypothetical protein
MNEEKLLLQLDLEQFLSKKQLVPRILSEFTESKEVNFSRYFAEVKLPEKFAYDLLVQMVIHKRATLPTLVGILRHHFDDSQATAEMLKKAYEASLVDWIPELKLFVVLIDISREVQEELDRFQYPFPTVVPPKPVKTNKDTGYYATRGSVILKANHHDDDVCLDHLNRMNQIQLSVNQDTATMVKNRWRNLDKPKVGESHSDFQKRRKQFEKYDRTAKDVMKVLSELNDHCHLTHKYDKRGRSYCMGYHVNYQGTAWNKAVIELHNKEVTQCP